MPRWVWTVMSYSDSMYELEKNWAPLVSGRAPVVSLATSQLAVWTGGFPIRFPIPPAALRASFCQDRSSK